MLSLQTYVRQSRHTLRKWFLDPRIHIASRAISCFLAGFLLSAASLTHRPLPLAMGLVCALGSWSSALAAFGSIVGYRLFWNEPQCAIWVVVGLILSWTLGGRKLARDAPLLLSAAAALSVAICGIISQTLYADTAPIYIFLLRVGLAGASSLLYKRALEGRNPIVDWLCWATGVLALSQLAPVS